MTADPGWKKRVSTKEPLKRLWGVGGDFLVEPQEFFFVKSLLYEFS